MAAARTSPTRPRMPSLGLSTAAAAGFAIPQAAIPKRKAASATQSAVVSPRQVMRKTTSVTGSPARQTHAGIRPVQASTFGSPMIPLSPRHIKRSGGGGSGSGKATPPPDITSPLSPQLSSPMLSSPEMLLRRTGSRGTPPPLPRTPNTQHSSVSSEVVNHGGSFTPATPPISPMLSPPTTPDRIASLSPLYDRRVSGSCSLVPGSGPGADVHKRKRITLSFGTQTDASKVKDTGVQADRDDGGIRVVWATRTGGVRRTRRKVDAAEQAGEAVDDADRDGHHPPAATAGDGGEGDPVAALERRLSWRREEAQEDALASAEADARDLEDRVVELEGELQALRVDLDESAADVHRAERRAHELQVAADDAAAEATKYESTILSLKSDVKQHMCAVEELTAQKHDFVEVLEKAEVNLTAVTAERDALAQDVAATTDEVAQLRTRIAATEAALQRAEASARGDAATAAAAERALKESQAAVNTEAARAVAELDVLKGEMQALVDAKTRLEGELATAAQEKEALAHDVAQNASALQSRAAEAAALREALDAKAAEAARVSRELEAIMAEKTVLSEAVARLEAVAGEAAALKNEAELLRARVAETSAREAALEEELEASKAGAARARAELEAAQRAAMAQVEGLEAELATSREVVTLLDTEKQTLKAERAGLTREVSMKAEEAAAARRECEASEAVVTQLRAELAEAQRETTHHVGRLTADLEVEKKTLAMERAAFAEEVSATKAEAAALQQRADRLEEHLAQARTAARDEGERAAAAHTMLQADLEARAAEISRAEAGLRVAAAEKHALAAAKAKLEADLKAASSDKAKLATLVERHGASLQVKTTEVGRLQDAVATTQRELAQTQAQLETLSASSSAAATSMRAALEATTREHTRAQAQLSEVEARLQAVDIAKTKLEVDCETARAEKAAAAVEAAQATAALEKVTRRAKIADAALETRSAELKKAEARIQAMEARLVEAEMTLSATEVLVDSRAVEAYERNAREEVVRFEDAARKLLTRVETETCMRLICTVQSRSLMRLPLQSEECAPLFDSYTTRVDNAPDQELACCFTQKLMAVLFGSRVTTTTTAIENTA